MAIFSPRCFISARRNVVTALTVLSTDIVSSLFEVSVGAKLAFRSDPAKEFP